MFEYLKGRLTKITAKYIVLEVAGIGYILHVANPYRYSESVNQDITIYTHQV
ncbi:OB-fold domain-containing protein, partial [Streptococcus pyogenes]